MVAVHHWFSPTIAGYRLPLGYLGVGLFFVLSGYLITGILLGVRDRAALTGASRWFATRAFMIRRLLRLVPAMLLYLGVLWVTGNFGDPDGWAWYVFYGANFRIEETRVWAPNLGHMWSLSVEEQFYLFAPFLTLFLPLELLRKFLPLAAIGIVVLTSLPTVAIASLVPPVAFLGLFVGCALAAHAGTASCNRLTKAWPVLTGAWLLMSISSQAGTLPAQFGAVTDLVGYGAMAGLVWGAANGFSSVTKHILENRVMLFLGQLSYGLYLWHLFTMVVRRTLFPGGLPLLLNLVVMTMITVALAYASYQLCERWFNGLKVHFPYLASGPNDGIAAVDVNDGSGGVREPVGEQSDTGFGDPGRVGDIPAKRRPRNPLVLEGRESRN